MTMLTTGAGKLTNIILFSLVLQGRCFTSFTSVAGPQPPSQPRQSNVHEEKCPKPGLSTKLHAFSPQGVNLVAGMLGGAIGVGAAYPFDTIKTKMQTFQESNPGMERPPILLVVKESLKDEGVQSFYNGVAPTMAGQAVIKGCNFWAYNFAQTFLKDTFCHGTELGALGFCLAAMFSGAASSFISTPVERIKCVMQASKRDRFKSPLNCVQDIVRSDGLTGFFGRGLGATLIREVPSFAIYFATYEFIKSTMLHAIADSTSLSSATWATNLVPAVGGAAAGALSWIPVYPIDVVKTNQQVNIDGGREESAWQVAQRLNRESGPMVFWIGLGPKLARAIVNHAVTFLVFENVVKFCAGQA